jgi:phage terminase large subunit
MDIEITVNKIYLPYLEKQTRIQIFFGGSSSGKSVFLAQRTILDVLKGRNYLVVRKVARTIRQSIFNELCKVINDMDLNSQFTINKTDMAITAKNGYQILSCGLDDVQKLKSITPAKGVITDILVEEATEIEYSDYKEISKRLRGVSDFKGMKRITFAFNPILQTSWLYAEFFGKWDDSMTRYEDENISILKTTFKDNAFLEQDDIERLENETDEYYYNVYTLGNWGVLGSVIFKNWKVEDCTEIRKTADNYKNGLDFGFASDPAALVRTHYDRKHKTIYILDELYQRGMTNDILAEEVKAMIGYEYVVCDSSEPKSIKELKNYGINAVGAKKGKDSVAHGIQWLQQQTIIIDVSCQNFKNEIQQYQWKEIQGQAVPIPIDKNNHLIDALRYSYEEEYKESTGPVNVAI